LGRRSRHVAVLNARHSRGTAATIQSDANGLASFPLSTAGISGDVAFVGSASLGNTSLQFAGTAVGPLRSCRREILWDELVAVDALPDLCLTQRMV